MTTLASSHAAPRSGSWLSRCEAWLDDKGKGAWIAAMVLAFILFWPIGLAFLAYMIWSKKMFSTSPGGLCRRAHTRHSTLHPTGNSAFDSYKAETLKRLEDEQASFEAFLTRLREARDKSEFDQFLDERAKAADAAEDKDDTA